MSLLQASLQYSLLFTQSQASPSVIHNNMQCTLTRMYVDYNALKHTCTRQTCIHYNHYIGPICMSSVDSVITGIGPENIVISKSEVKRCQ